MADGRNKQWREDCAKIGAVLMQEWDPIGVRDVPQAQDEYDSYVGHIYTMLMGERASADAIAAHLDNIATHRMGLLPTTEGMEHSRRVAETLVNLRPQFEAY
ncbi:MAG: hypothetical protein JO001_27655 [Alphaproteobacteria bacterium]|nr:hypothetical protein [Alphaproteobacteria bacterium]